MKKFIFLDIDGVLVTRKELMKPFKKDRNHDFNKKCVENLEWLLEQTGAEVVISSSWRIGRLEYMRDIFKNRGFKYCEKIIGETPRIHTLVFSDGQNGHWVPRGLEIKIFLEKVLQEKAEASYVIFDDDSDMLLEQAPHFFKTNLDFGLRYSDVIKAQQILGAKVKVP